MASHRLGKVFVFRRGCQRRSIITFLVLMTAATASASVSFTEYPTPSANGEPRAITLGPDGNLWFTECGGNKIGKITPAGAVVEYPLPTASSCPQLITLGPDGNLWFTEQIAHVGRITPQGVVVEYPIDAIVAGITTGPDGNLWVTDGINRVGRLTTSGVTTWFSLPRTNLPGDIVSGPDGNLWFTEFQYIGRITPNGAIQEFALHPSNPVAMRYEGNGIARGADGNLWFTEEESAFDPSVSVGRNVGRITPQGDITLFAIPGAGHGFAIAPGPDGNVWFTDTQSAIGRITPYGAISLYTTPTSTTLPGGIVTGPDGALWFTEFDTSVIGRLMPSSDPITLGGYLSGNWYDPAFSGQGFQLEFATGHTLVAIWFTFTPDGSGQSWIYAQGSYDSNGKTVTLPVQLLTGASFFPNFSSNDVTRTSWGTLTFTFADCNSAFVVWNSTLPGYGSGSLPLRRLTQIDGTSCP